MLWSNNVAFHLGTLLGTLYTIYIYKYISGIYVYAATVILCVATQPASKLKDLLGGTRGLRVPERALGQKGEK